MTWLVVVLGIMALVVLHEAGHFAAAKAVGMRVEKFSLFFGRMLVKVRRGETTYGIGWLPLGGYVKISGMSPHEDLPPDVAPRAYLRQPVWKRIVVILAGPAVNLVIAFALVWGLLAIHGVSTTTRSVGAVERGSVAAGALRAGDRIVAVDGRRDLTAEQVSRQISSHRCPGRPAPGCQAATPVRITVSRDGALRTFALTPRYDPVAGKTRVGFGFGSVNVPQPVGSAARQSVSALWDVTTTTVSRFGQIFVSSQARKDVHSIVGGAQATREAFGLSVATGLYVIALLSLTLAVVNLFPFLPLDGGHVFWALAEKVRGRAIPFTVMERTGVIGFALIMFVFAVGLSNDIPTLLNGRSFLR